MRFFEWYQYLAPAIGLPLLAWAWSGPLGWSKAVAFLGVLVLQAYLVPGLGTNWTRLYEFRSRLRWGRFRPHHGFVFGVAGALFAWLGRASSGPWVVTPLCCAGLTWVYDSIAIQRGFIIVYNEPWSKDMPAWRIAADYAVPYFLTYGVVLTDFTQRLERVSVGWAGTVVAGFFALSVLPVAALVLWSWLLYGHSGLWPRPAKSQGA